MSESVCYTKCVRAVDAGLELTTSAGTCSSDLARTGGLPRTDMLVKSGSRFGGKVISLRAAATNITSNKRLKRFSLRGKTKVNGQWQLYCLVHNIEKLANYGSLAA